MCVVGHLGGRDDLLFVLCVCRRPLLVLCGGRRCSSEKMDMKSEFFLKKLLFFGLGRELG